MPQGAGHQRLRIEGAGNGEVLGDGRAREQHAGPPQPAHSLRHRQPVDRLPERRLERGREVEVRREAGERRVRRTDEARRESPRGMIQEDRHETRRLE